jgi:hypothetical protein
MALELVTKIETIDSINSINSLQQIETKIEIKKQNQKQTESQTKVQQMDVIIIDDNESQLSSHVKQNQFKYL